MLSVVTLVRDRNPMLREFLRGFTGQTDSRFEVVIVRAGGVQDPECITRLFPDLPIATHRLRGDDDVIPYSRARNTGARHGVGEHLVFCDADTIPTASFVANMHRALDQHDALLSGEVLYLPPIDVDACTLDELTALGRPHPARERPPEHGVRVDARHELVWGLCMAMRRSTFERIGGFDERYGGYAGEDTDLAVACRAANVPAGLVAGAAVLHQHHDSYDPPVQQLAATLANAQRFRDKWGRWPMEGWLSDFERMGLIDRTIDRVTVARQPTAGEIDACRQQRAAPFRTATSP